MILCGRGHGCGVRPPHGMDARPHAILPRNSSIPMALVTTMMLPASVSYYCDCGCGRGRGAGQRGVRRLGRISFQPLCAGLCGGCGKLAAAGVPLPGALHTAYHCQHAERHAGGIARHGAARGRHTQPSRVDLVLGNYAGAIGTTSVLVIIACALYLWVRRDITVSIPAGFFLSIVCVAFFFPRIGDVGLAWPWQELHMRYQSVKYELPTGTLLFAGVFLVNEPVTRPRVAKAHLPTGY